MNKAEEVTKKLFGAICPSCKKQIDFLEINQSGSWKETFSFQKKKRMFDYDEDSPSNYQVDSNSGFQCPECNYSICLTEEEAIKFLYSNIIKN